MKTIIGILLLATLTIFFSCKQRDNFNNDGHHDHNTCDIEKPSDLKPIDWNGWNDAYTVGYTFHDNIEDACFDYDGDTMLCYGHITKNLYIDYPSLTPEWIWLEGSENQEDGQCVRILFDTDILLNDNERDSLVCLLNSSTHADTCFVKGIFKIIDYKILQCTLVFPSIGVTRLEDICFR